MPGSVLYVCNEKIGSRVRGGAIGMNFVEMILGFEENFTARLQRALPNQQSH